MGVNLLHFSEHLFTRILLLYRSFKMYAMNLVDFQKVLEEIFRRLFRSSRKIICIGSNCFENHCQIMKQKSKILKFTNAK